MQPKIRKETMRIIDENLRAIHHHSNKNKLSNQVNKKIEIKTQKHGNIACKHDTNKDKKKRFYFLACKFKRIRPLNTEMWLINDQSLINFKEKKIASEIFIFFVVL